jgi:hypothetical protein
MAKALRTLPAPARLRNPRRPLRPHVRARGLVDDEHDEILLTPPPGQPATVEIPGVA